MTTEQEALKDLYSVTGNVTDINTLLIGRDELRKLVAEREADRAAMREALEALEQATTGWSKPSEKWLHVSEEAIPVADAAITHLCQRLEGTT